MRGSHGQEQLTGLLKDPCSPAGCLTSVNLRPSSVKWGNTHIDSRGLLKTERDKARVWPTVLDKRSVFSLGARSLFLHEDAMAGGEMNKDTQVFLPPGSSFGVWSHSPSPILCLAQRLPGGIGDRAPRGTAKWLQLLIYPPRLEHSGLLAGLSISVRNLAEIYRSILAGCGLWEG